MLKIITSAKVYLAFVYYLFIHLFFCFWKSCGSGSWTRNF